MKVAAYPADLGGCGHYRIIWPARTLAATGHDITLTLPDDNHTLQVYCHRRIGQQPRPDDPIGQIDNLPDADIIVFQRPLRQELVVVIAWLQTHGYRVIVETDDDYHALSPRNIARAALFRDGGHPKWLMAACEIADLVTVTTPALATRYGRHGRFAVLPNCIPASYLDIERPAHDGIVVGWSGSLDTHPDDLQTVGGSVAQTIRDTGARFSVIGTGIGVQHALGLDHKPTATGWVTLDAYPHGFAHFDIGIVPLEPTPFNEAKSWLKGLEMAAVGTPFVAAPTSEYRKLAELGAGDIATRPRHWRTLLTRLIQDHDHRAERAAAAKATAATLTYEQHADHWWTAWHRALDRQAVA